jgi:hypothetical protein
MPGFGYPRRAAHPKAKTRQWRNSFMSRMKKLSRQFWARVQAAERFAR